MDEETKLLRAMLAAQLFGHAAHLTTPDYHAGMLAEPEVAKAACAKALELADTLIAAARETEEA